MNLILLNRPIAPQPPLANSSHRKATDAHRSPASQTSLLVEQIRAGMLREGSPAPAFPHPSGSGQAPGEAGGGGRVEPPACPRGAHRPRSLRAMRIAKRGPLGNQEMPRPFPAFDRSPEDHSRAR